MVTGVVVKVLDEVILLCTTDVGVTEIADAAVVDGAASVVDDVADCGWFGNLQNSCVSLLIHEFKLQVVITLENLDKAFAVLQ